MVCRLCSFPTKFIFKNKVLTKYNVSYFRCNTCKLIQTEEPYWLDEAYQESISVTDTGILERNFRISKNVTILLSLKKETNVIKKIFRFLLNKPKIRIFNQPILDLGGGYGLMVRMLRDIGFDAYWKDQYSKNIFAKYFEEKNNYFPILTCFELWEHYQNPKKELDEIFINLKPDLVMVSSSIYGQNIPNIDWWYFSYETGQHISFYNKETIDFIANKYNYNYEILSDDFFIFTNNNDYQNFYTKELINSESLFKIIKSRYQSKTFHDHELIKQCLKK